MNIFRALFILPLRIIIILAQCLCYSWLRCQWYPTSKHWLKGLDTKIRSLIKHQNSSQMVKVKVNQANHFIWTVTVKGDRSDTVPIVLIHSITGGYNLFLNNIDEIAKHRDVYLLDLPGWGFSGKIDLRTKLEDGWWVGTTADDMEVFYAKALEGWLQELGLKKVILLGHGFGSYISSIYCMYYPRRVVHLILTEPWGFYRRPAAADNRPFMVNASIKLISELYAMLLIFTPIRALGPLALPLYRIFRLGMKEKFTAFWKGLDPQTTSHSRIKTLMMEERSQWFPDMTMQDYTYLWMMHSKSGEYAYHRLSIPFGWACKPLEERLDHLPGNLDITFIFGSKSWVISQSGWETKHHRHDSYVEVHEIGGAGHHVYADRPSAFNSIVTMIGKATDKGIKPNISEGFKQRSKDMSRLRRQVSSSMMLQEEKPVFRQPRSREISTSSFGEVDVFTIGKKQEHVKEKEIMMEDENEASASPSGYRNVDENSSETGVLREKEVFFTLG